MIGSYIIVTSKSSHILIANAFSFSRPTATVIFDFDACEYTDFIKTSIQALTFSNQLNSILDTYLDPVLHKAIILPESFSDDVKSIIVTAAESKVNEVKNSVNAQLDVLFGNCVRRRLGNFVEVKQDGSERLLTTLSTFTDLAASIQSIVDGVVSHHFPTFCWCAVCP